MRLLVTGTLLVLALVSIFVRDVVRAAHATASNERSTAHSFTTLANAQERSWVTLNDDALRLLAAAPTLTPAQAEGQWRLLRQEATREAAVNSLLDNPGLPNDVNTTMQALTTTRLGVFADLAASVEGPLLLADVTTPSSSTLARDDALLRAADASFATVARQVANLRVGARLTVTPSPLAAQDLASLLGPSLQSATLAPVGGVSLVAVQIDPQPLPASSSRLVLLPVSSITIGVSVKNSLLARQHVTVDVSYRVTKGSGAAFFNSEDLLVAGGGAAAVSLPAVPLTPGDQGVLAVTLHATHHGAVTRRVWPVTVAP